jgi:hypothetical protein
MGPDLVSPKWMYLKAIGFVLIAFLCAACLFMKSMRHDTVVLIVCLVWASARAYYFCFYVIEKYIDPAYKFAGIGSAIRHVLRRRSTDDQGA